MKISNFLVSGVLAVTGLISISSSYAGDSCYTNIRGATVCTTSTGYKYSYKEDVFRGTTSITGPSGKTIYCGKENWRGVTSCATREGDNYSYSENWKGGIIINGPNGSYACDEDWRGYVRCK